VVKGGDSFSFHPSHWLRFRKALERMRSKWEQIKAGIVTSKLGGGTALITEEGKEGGRTAIGEEGNSRGGFHCARGGIEDSPIETVCLAIPLGKRER